MKMLVLTFLARGHKQWDEGFWPLQVKRRLSENYGVVGSGGQVGLGVLKYTVGVSRCVGAVVFCVVGLVVGAVVGCLDGIAVGLVVGTRVGANVGCFEGFLVGLVVGLFVGARSIAPVGVAVGAADGFVVGEASGRPQLMNDHL